MKQAKPNQSVLRAQGVRVRSRRPLPYRPEYLPIDLPDLERTPVSHQLVNTLGAAARICARLANLPPRRIGKDHLLLSYDFPTTATKNFQL